MRRRASKSQVQIYRLEDELTTFFRDIADSIKNGVLPSNHPVFSAPNLMEQFTFDRLEKEYKAAADALLKANENQLAEESRFIASLDEFHPEFLENEELNRFDPDSLKANRAAVSAMHKAWKADFASRQEESKAFKRRLKYAAGNPVVQTPLEELDEVPHLYFRERPTFRGSDPFSLGPDVTFDGGTAGLDFSMTLSSYPENHPIGPYATLRTFDANLTATYLIRIQNDGLLKLRSEASGSINFFYFADSNASENDRSGVTCTSRMQQVITVLNPANPTDFHTFRSAKRSVVPRLGFHGTQRALDQVEGNRVFTCQKFEVHRGDFVQLKVRLLHNAISVRGGFLNTDCSYRIHDCLATLES